MSNQYAQLPSFKTVWLKAVGFADMEPTAKLIAFVIGAHMNAEGRAWPSLVTIADMASVGVSTVKRRIPQIEAATLLEIERGGGRHKKSVYQAAIPAHLWTRFPEELVQRVLDTGSLDEERGSSDLERGPLTIETGSPGEPRSSSEVEDLEVVEVQNLEVPDESSGGFFGDPKNVQNYNTFKPITDSDAEQALKHAKAWRDCRAVASKDELLKIPEQRLWRCVVSAELDGTPLRDLIEQEVARAA